jgi:hypothetical protein
MGALRIKGATSGSTTITAPDTGGDESIELSTVLASKLDLAGGKILQIVRATDSTNRSTTSTSYVDVTGMSVTITPQKSDSAILLLASFRADTTWTTGDIGRGFYQITDNSNNALSGAQEQAFGTRNVTGTGSRDFNGPVTIVARDTPAILTATTYKLRFRSDSSDVTTRAVNAANTGQMYAIEVSA